MISQSDLDHPMQGFCDFLKAEGWRQSENLAMSDSEMERFKALWRKYKGDRYDDTPSVMPPAQQERLFRSLEKFRSS